MEEKTKIPTCLTNDANAAAYAEMLYGNAKGMKNFALITLGTGLGSGIIVDGKILYGNDGLAGEFGHTIAIRDGRLCACGRKGCLETYVSATGIVKTTKDLLKNKTTKSLLRKTPSLNAENIYIAALKKDIIAIEAFQITGEILGKQLADFIALFSPEAVILSGGLAKAHDILIPIIKNSLNENILDIFKNKTKIIPSALLEKNAGLLGAAALVNN